MLGVEFKLGFILLVYTFFVFLWDQVFGFRCKGSRRIMGWVLGSFRGE